ncbi:MarR family winged helix-turn-helix transcriptional regulator [Corynebacterium cystitidis]|uniref:DNA-binding transcriptional regulator, MarR family n=1 Tax=Corynebacterium cystitidis DSM 20524 TaxID=1121357 RepID=A0A1H9S717_9CORY|nr:MarR family transcriptional regulator [Corynebacterium cystitidis]WJY82218.1 transcriptional repressor MprA [Corynebacterium cystitidis DSM 20524]SER80163.1 DNA-binding transcriptional regulator, MarR family [Corynebacterium cystitidis DSM 20524]SNV77689.1 transcription factor [Corynebacterium cystitidis]
MDKTRWLNQKETDTWLALWAVSSWMPTRLDEQLKADNEMNLHDYFTLAQVSLADDGRLSMTELACRTQMSPSRLSHVVGRLEKRGLVERNPDEQDRRTNIASVTPEGWDFLDNAAPGHVERVREIVFDPLTKEEAEQFGVLLQKILKKLDPPALPRA